MGDALALPLGSALPLDFSSFWDDRAIALLDPGSGVEKARFRRPAGVRLAQAGDGGLFLSGTDVALAPDGTRRPGAAVQPMFEVERGAKATTVKLARSARVVVRIGTVVDTLGEARDAGGVTLAPHVFDDDPTKPGEVVFLRRADSAPRSPRGAEPL